VTGKPAYKPEGIDKRYLSIKEKQEPIFKKDMNKWEAGVIPSGPSI
jgi:hypothetical protein